MILTNIILDNTSMLGRSANLSEPVFSKLPMHVTKSNTVKDPFKVEVRPMDFNVIRVEMFIENFSDFILQIIFKKLSFVEFWYSIKEHPQLFE